MQKSPQVPVADTVKRRPQHGQNVLNCRAKFQQQLGCLQTQRSKTIVRVCANGLGENPNGRGIRFLQSDQSQRGPQARGSVFVV